MKHKALLLCAVILVGCIAAAHAWMMHLTEPSLSFSAGFSRTTITNMQAALIRPDCKFLEGTALNWFSTFKYAGDTVALNHFMEGIAKCPGVTLSVHLDADRPATEVADWMVMHNGQEPAELVVHVNLKSTNVILGKLVIPAIQGPVPSDANPSK
jgi:hypothetical protein